MRDLRYIEHMQDYTCYNGVSIKWVFPENTHIIKDTLYEVEYRIIDSKEPSGLCHTYKVTYIKPVSALVERINYIVNIFNKMNQADAFEKWFRERYKLLVIPMKY